MTNNPQLKSWFDAGKIEESLIGDGELFRRDYTSGDHDVLLVIGQLMLWATDAKHGLAVKGFSNAFSSLIARGEFKRAIRLLVAYHVIKEHSPDMYCDLHVAGGSIDAPLEQLVLNSQELLNSDDEFRCDVLRVLDWHSRVKERVGL